MEEILKKNENIGFIINSKKQKNSYYWEPTFSEFNNDEWQNYITIQLLRSFIHSSIWITELSFHQLNQIVKKTIHIMNYKYMIVLKELGLVTTSPEVTSFSINVHIDKLYCTKSLFSLIEKHPRLNMIFSKTTEIYLEQ
ncbi:hypothetical protein ACTFIY_003231 [Dictyostelium cf. discoideum]